MKQETIQNLHTFRFIEAVVRLNLKSHIERNGEKFGEKTRELTDDFYTIIKMHEKHAIRMQKLLEGIIDVSEVDVGLYQFKKVGFKIKEDQKYFDRLFRN